MSRRKRQFRNRSVPPPPRRVPSLSPHSEGAAEPYMETEAPNQALYEEPKASDIPDGIEPILAWRNWRLRGYPDHPHIVSNYNNALWVPKKPTVALCALDGYSRQANLLHHSLMSRGHTGYPPPTDHKKGPVLGCSCGLYGLQGPEWAGRSAHTYMGKYRRVAGEQPIIQEIPATIYGCVAFWGRIIVGTTGYRAQYGYPKALYIATTEQPSKAQEALACKLAMLYGIPVGLYTPPEILNAALDTPVYEKQLPTDGPPELP